MGAPSIALWLLAHVWLLAPPAASAGTAPLSCSDPRAPAIALALGADCGTSEARLRGALQRFQRRHQRSVDVADGRLDARTERYLQMVFPSLRSPGDACFRAAPGRPGELPGCLLRWEGATPAQRAFMETVYEAHLDASRGRRTPVIAAAGDVEEIEPGATARADVARATRRLLAAARADAPAGGGIGVVTGYRSAPFQLEIWEHHFPARYRETTASRTRARGGPHGRAAARLLKRRIAARTAAPGYSLHQRGEAIDLRCVTAPGEELLATGRYLSEWKRSWCWRWLRRHASEFGFHPNEDIDEPWHWEFRTK